MKKKDEKEFELFCKQATNEQIQNILDKEVKAGRNEYAEIARREVWKRLMK